MSARYIKQVRLRSRDRSARIMSPPTERSALSTPLRTIHMCGSPLPLVKGPPFGPVHFISLFQEQLHPKTLMRKQTETGTSDVLRSQPSPLTQATDARRKREGLVTTLLSQRRMPKEGWDDNQIQLLLRDLALMDSNNFVDNVVRVLALSYRPFFKLTCCKR